MACASSSRVWSLLRFSGGGGGDSIGAISGEGRRSLLLLLVFSAEDVLDGVIPGEQEVRLVAFYLGANRVEMWAFPLLGSLSGWLAVMLASLDSYFGVLPSDLGAGYAGSYPSSAMARRSPKLVQRWKMRPSGSVAPDLAAYQKFGVFCYGDGWIWLWSGCWQAEQLIGEEDMVLDVISSFFFSSWTLSVKGGCTGCTVLN